MGDVSETRRRRDVAGPHGRWEHQSFPGLPRSTPHRARPDQGRHAVRAFIIDGRNGGAGDVDELEMRAGTIALRRRQGRSGYRSDAIVAQRTGGGLAPLHAGNDPVRRPAHRHHGAGHGHERTDHGLVHGHLFGLHGLRRQRNRTGKPVAIGGTEGRREATGRGVVYLIERAMNMLKMNPEKCTAIVQGFGNVGSVAALSLAYKSGVNVVGISDAHAAIYNPKGIDVKAAEQHMLKKGNLRAFAQDDRVDPKEFLTLPCDILVPAAVDRVITGKNAGELKCRILAEAANGPTTPDADLILENRWDEIFVIPDILCNAGGVIVSYFEWVQGLQAFLWTESEVTDKLFRILEHSFAQVIRRAKEHKISHRTAAMAIGVERVIKAKQVRGLFP